MNKTPLLLLLCVTLSSCKFHHIISHSRPELQWQDKTHCIVDSREVWSWPATPENEKALQDWWQSTDDLGTEDYWPKGYTGVKLVLHPRLFVRFSNIATVFAYNPLGHTGFDIYSRRPTEADRKLLLHLQHIIHTQQPLSEEKGESLERRICPPIPRNSETAWMP
ncbi:MAG: hypothetical protein IKJ58_08670 [Akkermansia sp.]|nr:hypothetical protein [Akkermansia sp.]